MNRRAEALIQENIELSRAIKDLAEGTHGKVVNSGPGAGVAVAPYGGPIELIDQPISASEQIA